MRRKRIFVWAVGIVLVAFMLVLQQDALPQQSAEQLYEAALLKKNADGDLEGAMEIFRQILTRFPEERAVAAKSQLQIGICYEKLGQEKSKLAHEAFQKVIDNYPKQVEAVKVAREKLSGLLRAQSTIEKENGGLNVRQLLSGPELLYDGWLGAVSPDGRYVSIVDWETGDLAIRDLITGKKQRLTDQKDKEVYALFSRWSPDGKKIIYDWWKGNSFVDLRIIGIEEKKPRTVFKKTEARPFDWCLDGEHILIGYLEDDKTGIKMALLSLKDDTVRDIKQGLPQNTNSRISPDGRYIAYNKPQEASSNENDIFIFSIENGKDIPLIEHPAKDEVFGWSPDGCWVLFGSARLGSYDAWIVPVSNGKAEGDPRLVKKGIKGSSALGFSQDGSFYYMTSKYMDDIYTTSVNSATGEILKPPQKMILPEEGNNHFPVYSPDGKKLAYICDHMDRQVLHIRSQMTGQEQAYPLQFQALFPRWSPDGRTILITALPRHHYHGIYQLDLQTGDVSSVLQVENRHSEGAPSYNEWAPDGKSFYFIQMKRDESDQIYLYNLETEKKEKIQQLDSRYGTISLSPDGKWLAFLGREAKRELKVIPVEGGEPRVLCRFHQGGNAPISLAWTPDCQYILFFKKTETDVLGQELCRVPVSGGDLQELGVSMIGPDHLRVHPNGQKIVFSSQGFSIPYPEFWVMENFLPKLKSKR